MATWDVSVKTAYLSDFVQLDRNLQKAVVRAITELEQDPATVRGNTIKKLQGYDNVWRYRVGDLRLIYAVDHGSQMLRLLAIGPRASIYERFNYHGWDAPGASVEFGPRMKAQPEWMRHPEWFKPEAPRQQKERLPRKLTPTLLRQWQVPAAYHPVLMRCLYAEELMKLSKEIPDKVLTRVLEGLYPQPVDKIAAQPDQVLLDPEDLLDYAAGSLTTFLLRLDEQQRALADWALHGPTLVKGGPGSGKSTVALYRIRALVAQALEETGDVPAILFTTYTNALLNASESLLRQLLRETLALAPEDDLPSEIRIATLHKTALWIAHTSGASFTMASESDRQEALQAARHSLRPRAFGDVARLQVWQQVEKLRDDYLLEEFDWVIEGQDCRRLEDYLAARRVGRGTPFAEKQRHAVWQLYAAYRDYLLTDEHYTWGYLLQVALDQVRAADGFRQRWDYVIVDEAQDLPPVGLALCVELAREPAGLFLAADANQSLYNRGFRWTYVHDAFDVRGRTRILRRNYRSTEEIAAAAAEILAVEEGFDAEAVTQEYVHAGAFPVRYAASGSEDQARWIVRQILEAARELRLPPNAAAVLVRSSSVGIPLAAALEREGVPTTFMKSQEFDLDDPRVKVTTLHAAKGLEFPIVVVAHVEAGRLPPDIAATDREELSAFLQAERRLFYVGCTRAMRYLFVTYDRHLPSSFLDGLSDERWMQVDAVEG